ncbi:hypothetical protein ACH0B5_16990 [Ureibacillus sp. 179-F W5.1 NHS]|nr:hypothetical protein [Lysinibacillus halotolerans]
MSSTYILYNIVPLGFLFLLMYIFIDILLDYFRKSKSSNVRRILIYSFLFYCISLIQIKFGGITIPPQNPNDIHSSFLSSNDWFGIYDTMHINISIWSSILLFIPLGIYLTVLIHSNNLKKLGFMIVISCLGIDISRLLFEWFGLVMSHYNMMEIIYLLCNIAGGILGFILVNFARKAILSDNVSEAEV